MLLNRYTTAAIVATSLMTVTALASARAVSHPSSTRGANAPSKRASLVKNARSIKLDECGECSEKLAKKGTATKSRAKVPCHPAGYVDKSVAPQFNAAMRDLKRRGVEARITSAWRSSEDQEKLHRCSLNARCRGAHPGLFGAARSGESAHEGGFAVDISGIAAGARGERKLTPQGRKIIEVMNKHGYKWKYGLADPVHFEADPRTHGYSSLKQAIAINQTRCQPRFITAKKTAASKKATNPRTIVGTSNVKYRTAAAKSKSLRRT